MLGGSFSATVSMVPTDFALRFWLQANGSLTSRLRRHGHVTVHVLAQGRMRLWREEQEDLGTRSGYVREVVLLLNGMPVVWARSATPLHAIQGPWRAMQGLGTRPLAELLFEGRKVERAPLRAHHLAKSSPLERHLRNQWVDMPVEGTRPDAPRWARSSVFWHKGQPLRVMEAFSPWVVGLSSARSHAPDAGIANR